MREGLNQYTIEGSIKGKSYTIANIDLYLLSSTAPHVESDEDETMKQKIKVVYYNNLESNFAIKQLRDLFTQAGILENFLFEQISSPEALEAKLVLGEYDILLNTINIGMKKDILKILTTSDPLINPSKYTNPNLTNLFKQHTKSPQKEDIMSQIDKIYAQDLPFVILGYPYDFVNIKTKLLDSEYMTGLQELYEYNWRNYLFQNISLVQNTVIDFAKLKEVRSFVQDLVATVSSGALVGVSTSLSPEDVQVPLGTGALSS